MCELTALSGTRHQAVRGLVPLAGPSASRVVARTQWSPSQCLA